jgi:hypothetical protein
MFATEPRLLSIGTMVISTSIYSNQPIKLMTSIGLNLIKRVSKPIEPVLKPPILSNILVKPMLIQTVQLAIPPNTF